MKNTSEEDQKIKQLSHHLEEIIKIIGENPLREGLLRTPERSAKALLYITKGYNENIDDIVGNAIFESNTRD